LTRRYYFRTSPASGRNRPSDETAHPNEPDSGLVAPASPNEPGVAAEGASSPNESGVAAEGASSPNEPGKDAGESIERPKETTSWVAVSCQVEDAFPRDLTAGTDFVAQAETIAGEVGGDGMPAMLLAEPART
jgi:hypothetical protein